MDIEYLLSLQNFRDAGGQWLAPIMNGISKFAVNFMILIPIVLFWAYSREEGYWYLLNLGLSDFVNNIVKLAACVYRPWVRDARVQPYGDAKVDATGYSFPSGHTVGAMSAYGAVGVKQWKSRKWLSILMFLLVLLTGFSRNYLGVHTPQDVLVGILEPCVVMLFVTWLLKHIHGDEKKQDLWTGIGLIAVLAGLLFIELKGYPMDYDAEGLILVDPHTQMKDAYMSFGTMLGFLAGSLWERKKIHFDPSGTAKEKIIRVVIGLIVVLAIYLGLRRVLASLIGVKIGNLIGMFLLTLFVVGIYPFLIMKQKAKQK